jgi:TldD protein
MKVKMSDYLIQIKPISKKLVKRLEKEYAYVSLLGTDVSGKQYLVRRTGVEINNIPFFERGFVVRLYNGKNYSEYSFNELNEDNFEEVIENINKVSKETPALIESKGNLLIETGIINEESDVSIFNSELEIHPEDLGHQKIIENIKQIHDIGLKISDELIDLRVRYEYNNVSKIFISSKKDLAQSYLFSTGAIIPIASREGKTKYTFATCSGLVGAELMDTLKNSIERAVSNCIDLLGANKMIPGEYDIICDPDMTGLIAHEAFGHGVEMDMFVKNRAKAKEYMGKKVASDILVMHDGAKSAQEVSSFLFDDEGTIGTDTIIIKNGILENGISDNISALRLGINPTGNGKRESFERKAYTRMTNTFFANGIDNIEDMIGSIDHGFLLEGFQSGMEDPKNWGIQCVSMMGKEIRDGRLTGKVYAPIYLTGYVPTLLESISMISDGLVLKGSGYCGKGHKELVKTSTGGSYIKCRGRLS